MKGPFYRELNKYVRAEKVRRQWVLLLNELITYVIMLIYLICLIVMTVHHSYKELFLLIGAPLAGFILARFLRMILKVPRPYQVLRIRPLLRKRSDSYSLPSCHIASAFVIGVSLCSLHLTAPGIIVIILGIILAVMRVLAGAHYVRDVLAGAGLGILCGLVPYVIH